MNTAKILSAMKAKAIPEGESGLWSVSKLRVENLAIGDRNGKETLLDRGTYTYLRRLTVANMLREPPGDVVMEDTPYELSTHLGFILQASGRVLVTGLGLGCVVRGLLRNSAVEHVTCIENSKDVLALVAGYMPKRRLTIIEADALEWTARNTERFDCAWHDLWTDMSAGEPHLDRWHTVLLMNCKGKVGKQGAWAFNRSLKTWLIRRGFNWAG